MDIFNLLGNKNRREIIKVLFKNELHISALAREINIATPVALRHIKLLEKAGLIERKKFGSTHVFSIKKEMEEKLEKVMNLLDDAHEVRANKGDNLASVLEKVPGIKVEHTKQGAFISSIDKNKGYFMFEVNGKLVDKSPDLINIDKDTTIELKRLVPVVGKKITIKVK